MLYFYWIALIEIEIYSVGDIHIFLEPYFKMTYFKFTYIFLLSPCSFFPYTVIQQPEILTM